MNISNFLFYFSIPVIFFLLIYSYLYFNLNVFGEIKKHIKYSQTVFIKKKFLKKIFLISTVFFILVLIINLIEESTFLKETDTTFLTPLLLTFLNAPSLLYEMFPLFFNFNSVFFH